MHFINEFKRCQPKTAIFNKKQKSCGSQNHFFCFTGLLFSPLEEIYSNKEPRANLITESNVFVWCLGTFTMSLSQSEIAYQLLHREDW